MKVQAKFRSMYVRGEEGNQLNEATPELALFEFYHYIFYTLTLMDVRMWALERFNSQSHLW